MRRNVKCGAYTDYTLKTYFRKAGNSFNCLPIIINKDDTSGRIY